MPTYEFRCPNGHEFELFHRRISDAPRTMECAQCGETAELKLSGGAGLVFKGSGFYLTDYGKNAHRSSGPAPGEKGGDKGGDGGAKADGGGKEDAGAGKADSSSGGAGGGAGGASSGASGSAAGGASGGGSAPGGASSSGGSSSGAKGE